MANSYTSPPPFIGENKNTIYKTREYIIYCGFPYSIFSVTPIAKDMSISLFDIILCFMSVYDDIMSIIKNDMVNIFSTFLYLLIFI